MMTLLNFPLLITKVTETDTMALLPGWVKQLLPARTTFVISMQNRRIELERPSVVVTLSDRDVDNNVWEGQVPLESEETGSVEAEHGSTR
jgi:hypothetical protein